MKKAPRRKGAAKTRGAKKIRRVGHIPAGYHEVTPYLSVRGATRALEFYKQAFGATEVMRMPGPEGKLGHAEIQIGGSRVMLSDEYPEMQFMGPETRGGTTVHLHLYVKDVDAMAKRAVAAGAKLIRPVEDKFYGDRSGSVEDPFGHVWHLATHTEDLSETELRKRAAQAAKQAG
jgi:PhnB protein